MLKTSEHPGLSKSIGVMSLKLQLLFSLTHCCCFPCLTALPQLFYHVPIMKQRCDIRGPLLTIRWYVICPRGPVSPSLMLIRTCCLLAYVWPIWPGDGWEKTRANFELLIAKRFPFLALSNSLMRVFLSPQHQQLLTRFSQTFNSPISKNIPNAFYSCNMHEQCRNYLSHLSHLIYLAAALHWLPALTFALQKCSLIAHRSSPALAFAL